jgi:hypothetical protein
MRLRLDTKSAVILAAGLTLMAGLAIDRRSTLVAYLVAWIAVAAVSIGALGVLITSYLVRRAWTEALHSIMTATAATLPLAGLLFIPILIGMRGLYPATAEHASLPAFKALYLAPPFFVLRSVVYFVVWSVLATWLRNAWNESERMTRAASVGLIVYTLTVSLAGIDWMESLEPEFHSSIYGLLFLSFVLLNGVAFTVGAGIWLGQRIGPIRGYSALLLSMILLWAYLHAMQYIVIWSANIPDEVSWYLKRSANGWQYLLIVLSMGQFIIPFFALLNERIRADRRWLAALCGLTLAMRCGEAAILIVPPLPRVEAFAMALMLPAALAFVGGTLWWMFLTALESRRRFVNPFAHSAHDETG